MVGTHARPPCVAGQWDSPAQPFQRHASQSGSPAHHGPPVWYGGMEKSREARHMFGNAAPRRGR